MFECFSSKIIHSPLQCVSGYKGMREYSKALPTTYQKKKPFEHIMNPHYYFAASQKT